MSVRTETENKDGVMTLRIIQRQEHSHEDLSGSLRTKELGKMLARERKKAGFPSQQSLLDAIKEETGLEINIQAWGRIERGQMPKFDQMVAFCMVCGGKNEWDMLLSEIALWVLPEEWRDRQENLAKATEWRNTVKMLTSNLEIMKKLAESLGQPQGQTPPGNGGLE